MKEIMIIQSFLHEKKIISTEKNPQFDQFPNIIFDSKKSNTFFKINCSLLNNYMKPKYLYQIYMRLNIYNGTQLNHILSLNNN